MFGKVVVPVVGSLVEEVETVGSLLGFSTVFVVRLSPGLVGEQATIKGNVIINFNLFVLLLFQMLW